MEPFSRPAHFSRLRQLFWLFFLLTIAYVIWVRNYLSPLTSDELVQFEIAKTAGNARTIIQDWKNTGKYEQGVQSTYFAYIFMALYTLAIVFGCRFLSALTGNDVLMKGGTGFSWLVITATTCDLVENIALSRTIRGDISQWNVTVAYDLARVKFSIVIVCILFMLICLLYWGIGKLAKEKEV
jgi:hypothetical protein